MSTNPKFNNIDAIPYYNTLVDLYFNMRGQLYKNGITNKKDYTKAVERVRLLANYMHFRVIHAKEPIPPRSSEPLF